MICDRWLGESCPLPITKFSFLIREACFLRAVWRAWINVSNVNQSRCGAERSSMRITVRLHNVCEAAANGAVRSVGNKVPPPSSHIWHTSFT
ncbi:hypothetical protein C0J52_02176 [Blattella germanica]|nr:hypothetical protein C0J52_02176 [Blattella germanica]